MIKYILLFALLLCTASAQAAVYHARATGGSGLSCGDPDTGGTACTVSTGIARLTPGDTLYLRTVGGTYTGRYDVSALTSGTSVSRYTISGFSNEIPTIKPVNGSDGCFAGLNNGSNAKWITFSNIICDGGNQTGINTQLSIDDTKGTVQGITLDHFTYTNWTGALLVGIDDFAMVNSAATNMRCTGGCGPGDRQYGLYFAHGLRAVITDNTFANNPGGGVQLYPGSHGSAGIFARNMVYGNGQHISAAFGGLLIGGISSVWQVYDNVVRDNGTVANGLGGILVSVFNPANNTKVWNNTVVRNAGIGIQVEAGVTSAVIQNNILVNNSGNSITDSGTSTTKDHNICTKTVAPSGECTGTGAQNITTAALRLADIANNNFAPCTAAGVPHASCTGASPAIGTVNAGVDLHLSFTVDITGTTRLIPFSFGAYEPGVQQSPPVCPVAQSPAIAAWGFDGDGTDATGGGQTAVLGTGLTYTTGKYGQAVLYNGTAAVTVANDASHYFCTAWTLSGSLYAASAPTGFVGFISTDYSAGAGYYLYASTTSPDGASMGGYAQGAVADVIATYATPFTLNTWTDFAITYDQTLASGNIKLWINGIVVSTANGTATIDQSSGDLYIGGTNFGEFFPSGWRLDEVRIYNRALTPTQIATDNATPLTPLGVGTVVNLRVGPGITIKRGTGVTLKKGLIP